METINNRRNFLAPLHATVRQTVTVRFRGPLLEPLQTVPSNNQSD